jgi:exopolysaccharide biosynthesis WecB/TagA/CpsF family protein
MVLPDGQPVRWALNLLHDTGLEERVSGPNLMAELCDTAAREGIGIYLYGTDADGLADLSSALVQKFPGLKIAGSSPSRFGLINGQERKEIANRIKASGASLCFVGLGCPRQELFSWAMRDDVDMPLLAVGAAFDFHSGRAKHAPQWMQRAGLEWLRRLAADPFRLWRRYLILNPLYLCMLTAQWAGVWVPSTLRSNAKCIEGDNTLIPG